MIKIFRIWYEHIERFFYWGWKLKGNHDWDYSFFYEIMYLKLKRMYECFRDYSGCCWMQSENTKQMRTLRIAIELCRRLKDDDFRHTKDSEIYKKKLFAILEKNIEHWWD